MRFHPPPPPSKRRSRASFPHRMGLRKEKTGSLVRGVKTVFFLLCMLSSLLLLSAPVLLVVADALLPSALLSAFISSNSLPSLLTNYDFRASIIDIPLISVSRSLIIICVYFSCDGRKLSHGLYLAITSLCSLISAAVVVVKACVFTAAAPAEAAGAPPPGSEPWSMEALFFCSLALAVGHIVAAYRTSCRERRKLLVYRIDLEAVYALDNSFATHQKHVQGRPK